MSEVNNTSGEMSLHHEDEELLLKIQALCDNELDASEIPDTLKQIEGNYRLRDEYVQLLQLKRQLSGMPKLSLRKEWYESFEKRSVNKIPMVTGTVFALVYILWSLAFFGAAVLNLDLPGWFNLTGLVAMTASIISFIFNALWQRSTEQKNERSYKDVIR